MVADGDSERKITVGVCLMEKKMISAPMIQILDRLKKFDQFEIIHFEEKMILEDPIESWPICECLIAYYSRGYPLQKAEAYTALRNCFVINQLEQQHLLNDRSKVYESLRSAGVPVPSYIVVIREKAEDLDNFLELEDSILIGNKEIRKPFVEKPIHGDEHRIMIYYPSSAGGGMTELCRKIGNWSSEFHPDVSRVRRDGSYIYEEFMATGGTNLKVYTVGPEYVYAEAWKSPVVDGVATRSPDGKEVGYPVLLTPMEKRIARDVYKAFGQSVCGFDLLRNKDLSYVCDVNGWSFAKNSSRYYDDAACVLRKMFLDAKAPQRSSVIPPTLPWKINEPTQPSEGLTHQGSGLLSTLGEAEKLCCVIAVIQHGDITPRQKVELKVTEEKLIDLMLKYNGGSPENKAILKSPVQLQDLLDATRMLVSHSRLDRESDSEAEDFEHAEKLLQVKAVLEAGGNFAGTSTEVQLNPLNWKNIAKANGEGDEKCPVEAWMVLKYGGELTHAGRKQAEELGRYFQTLYPGTGLRHLHSTYRHDLTIYSSDECCVQMSAAAFAKGLLDLKSQLTPILVSLLNMDTYSLFNGVESDSAELNLPKDVLNAMINSGVYISFDEPLGLPSNTEEFLSTLKKFAKEVAEKIRLLAKDEDEERTNVDRISAGLPCGSESFLLLHARWKNLVRAMYNEHELKHDVNQVPLLYEACKYDLLHNDHLGVEGMYNLFNYTRLLASDVIANEYGTYQRQRLTTGSKIAQRVLAKILMDLNIARDELVRVVKPKSYQNQEDTESPSDCCIQTDDKEPSFNDMIVMNEENGYRLDPKYANVETSEFNLRTRLYFASEPHIRSLMNVFRYCHLHEYRKDAEILALCNSFEALFKAKELNCMSYIVLRMFENTEVPLNDKNRYRIETSFSSGADLSLLEPLRKNNSDVASLHRDHTLPILVPRKLQEMGSSYLTVDKLEEMIRPLTLPASDFPYQMHNQCDKCRSVFQTRAQLDTHFCVPNFRTC